jgi:Ni/Co efflux regulator RcnB
MRKRMAIHVWAALLATTSVALAQESPAAKPAEAEKAPGKRLRVELRGPRGRHDHEQPGDA